MTMTFDEDKPSPEEYLEHYGKKGMKWGVRKGPISGAIAGKVARQKKLDPKHATLREKLNVSGLQVIRSGGNLNKAALTKRKAEIDRRTRVIQGKAKASEVIREIGHVSLLDIAARNKK
jgi:hypothetical protein